MKPAREPMTRMQRVMEEAVFAKRKLASVFRPKKDKVRWNEDVYNVYYERYMVLVRSSL